MEKLYTCDRFNQIDNGTENRKHPKQRAAVEKGSNMREKVAYGYECSGNWYKTKHLLTQMRRKSRLALPEPGRAAVYLECSMEEIGNTRRERM